MRPKNYPNSKMSIASLRPLLVRLRLAVLDHVPRDVRLFRVGAGLFPIKSSAILGIAVSQEKLHIARFFSRKRSFKKSKKMSSLKNPIETFDGKIF